jgi:hypothetical protein
MCDRRGIQFIRFGAQPPSFGKLVRLRRVRAARVDSRE